MGVSHSVYMANNSGQDIYVMASLNPDWAIVDFIVDITLLIVGVEELRAATMVADLPAALVTFRDLFEFLKLAAKLLSGSATAGTRPGEAALALINAFKRTAVKLSYRTYKDVDRDNFLSIYLSASGVASLLGAETVSVMVLSGDGTQLAMWNTGADNSWIATGNKSIVRSKYGAIWQEDHDAGTIPWPVQK